MISLKNVCKIYENDCEKKYVLKNINLEFKNQGLYFILGKSGCGKSTLLNLIGKLDEQTNGKIIFDEKLINTDNFFKNDVSFVFQDNNLLYDFSVIENLSIINDDEDYLNSLLSDLGLSEQLKTKVSHLSGGEQQRLAIGRSIAKKSKVILLDEPTGNLDNKNAIQIYEILKSISNDKLVICVTHDLENAKIFGDYLIHLKDGVIIKEETIETEMKALIYKGKINDNILKIYDFLNFNTDETVLINNKIKNIKKETFISEIQNIIEEENADEIELSYKVIKKDNYNLQEQKNSYSNYFKFIFQLKYACKLIFLNKIKSFFSIFLLLITVIINVVCINVLTFDKNDGLLNATKNSEEVVYRIEQTNYNDITDEYFSVVNGDYLYDNLISFNDCVVDVLTLDFPNKELIQNPILLTAKNECLINVGYSQLLSNEIIVTDFFLEYYFDKTKKIGSIVSIDVGDMVIDFCIKDIIRTDYRTIYERFIDKDYVRKNENEIIHSYLYAITSNEIIIDKKMNTSQSFKASNFLLTNEDYKTYADGYNNSLIYDIYKQNHLLFGRAPEVNGEVVVSSLFLERNNLSIEEVLNQKFSFKDLDTSLNSVKYYGVFNVYRVLKDIKIVGVSSSDEVDLFVCQDLFKQLLTESYHYNSTNLGVFNVDREDIEIMTNENMKFLNTSILPVYFIQDTLNSSFELIIIYANVLMIVLCVFLIYYFSTIIISQKKKDIAILKSLGIGLKRVFSIFLLHNFIIMIITMFLAISFSLVIFSLFNTILASEDVFNISYNLFNYRVYTICYLVLLNISIIFLATLVPLNSISKISIAKVMKH